MNLSSTMNTYELNLDQPEDNVGVWAQIAINLVHDDKLYNAVVIQKNFSDAADYQHARISASLLPDGSGVVVTEPKAANFMINDVEKMYSKKDQETDPLFSKLYLAHAASANQIRNKPDRRSKETKYLFPDGIRGRMGIFNKASGLKLKTFVRGSEGTTLSVEDAKTRTKLSQLTVNFRCIWFVAIDEEERLIKQENDGDEDLLDACKRMSLDP
jgi:hypothetical protein